MPLFITLIMAIKSDTDSLSTKVVKNLRGIPNEFGLSDEQMLLKTQAKQLTLLEEINKRGSRSSSSTPHVAERSAIEVKAPDVHINIPNVAETLRPQFDSLVDAQRDLAEAVGHLGYTGEMSLRHNVLHSHQLARLDERARAAFDQRNAALRLLSEGVLMHERTHELLEGGNRLGAVSIHKLGDIQQALFSGFAELGSGIAQLSHQLAASTLAITEQLRGFEDVFLWAHQQQSAQLQRITERLENPVGTRSAELWRLGEVARRASHPDHAKRLFQQCLDENPTFARSYYSLAMIALDNGHAGDAKKSLTLAIDYAFPEPKLQAAFLLMMGKITRMEGNINEALTFGMRSFSADHLNLETWYELACMYAHIGNHEKVIYFLRNLIAVAQKKQHGYVARIVTTPVLFPYVSHLF